MNHPLCQYDVLGIGDRAFLLPAHRPPPCRAVARFVAHDWCDDGGDLFLCSRHARALVKRNDGDDIGLERLPIAAVNCKDCGDRLPARDAAQGFETCKGCAQIRRFIAFDARKSR